MSALSNHVVMNITRDSVGIARAGFGVPLIISYYAAFAERVRFYTDLLGVQDDFAIDTPEYLAAQAMFSQQPRPSRIAIGRGALKPTQRYSFNVTNVHNSTKYSIKVVGEGVTTTTVDYTTDSAATRAEIHNGLLTGLNAVVGKNYTAAFTPVVIADDTFTADAGDDSLEATAHALQTGDGPVRVSSSGTLPAGLASATDYWVIKIDADNFSLATSLANALAGTAINITDAGSGTHTLSDTASTVRPSEALIITASAAGEWFSLETKNIGDVDISQTHDDPGIATDLAAITVENNTWYGLWTMYNSNAMVMAASAWISANKKIYIAEVCETDAVNTASGNGDTLDQLEDLDYARVMPSFHPNPSNMIGARWLGRCLPLQPGSETWKFKTLVGGEPVTLTSTQRTNLTNRAGNSYETVANRNMTFEGTTSDGDFMDVQRFLDWQEDDMATSVFGAMNKNDKLGMSNAGIAVLENEMRGSLQRGVTRGGIRVSDGSIDPESPTVTVPRVEEVPSGDRAVRKVTGLKFFFLLEGAIHKAEITGVVSV
jgi:hypothetical protein